MKLVLILACILNLSGDVSVLGLVQSGTLLAGVEPWRYNLDEGRGAVCPIGQRPPSEVSHGLETILASAPIGAQQTASVTRSIIGAAAGQ